MARITDVAQLGYLITIPLAVVWWLIRGRPRAFDMGMSSDPLWVLAVPVSGLLIRAVGLPPLFVLAIQLACIGLLHRRLINRSAQGFLRPREAPSPSPLGATPPLLAPSASHARETQVASESSVDSLSQRRKIFLSYRREDSADVVGRIYDRLVERFGKEQVFKDVDSIPLGVDFRKHLVQMVGSCDILLIVIGVNWLTADHPGGKKRLDDVKDFVRIELEAALQRNIPLIPILVHGAQVPEEGELPTTLAALAYRNGMAVRSDPDFHRDMNRLIEGIQSHLFNNS